MVLLVLALKDVPDEVSFSLMTRLHSIQRFRRMLQSRQLIRWLQGRNVIVACSSSHNLHLLKVAVVVWARLAVLVEVEVLVMLGSFTDGLKGKR